MLHNLREVLGTLWALLDGYFQSREPLLKTLLDRMGWGWGDEEEDVEEEDGKEALAIENSCRLNHCPGRINKAMMLPCSRIKSNAIKVS